MQQIRSGSVQITQVATGKTLHHILRQHLAQLDPPLVKAVDVPQCAAYKDPMLIERQQSAQGAGAEFGQHHKRAGAVACDAALRVGIAYADAMTTDPHNVTDEQVDDLKRRFGEAGVIELTYQIGVENMRARMYAALGITEQGFSSGDACRVPWAE